MSDAPDDRRAQDAEAGAMRSESAGSDLEFEQYMEGSSELSATYREGSEELPPMHLDARVLGAARQLASQREPIAKPRAPMAPFSRHWAWPVSLAAVLLLSVSLVIVVQPEVELSDEEFVATKERSDLGSEQRESAFGSADLARSEAAGQSTPATPALQSQATGSVAKSQAAAVAKRVAPVASPLPTNAAPAAEQQPALQALSPADDNSDSSNEIIGRIGAVKVRAAEQTRVQAERRILDRKISTAAAERKQEAARILEVQTKRRAGRDAVIKQVLETVRKAEPPKATQPAPGTEPATSDGAKTDQPATGQGTTNLGTSMVPASSDDATGNTRQPTATVTERVPAVEKTRRTGARASSEESVRASLQREVVPVTERAPAPAAPVAPVPGRETVQPAAIRETIRSRIAPAEAQSRDAPAAATTATTPEPTSESALESPAVQEASDAATPAHAAPATPPVTPGAAQPEAPSANTEDTNERIYGLNTSRDISLALTVIRDFIEEGNTKAAKQALETLLRRYPDAEIPADISVILAQ